MSGECHRCGQCGHCECDRDQQNVMGSHWEGCWQVHLDCAIARIERLEELAASGRISELVYELTAAREPNDA